MESKVNYTAVGIFVVLLGLAFIYFVFWLTTAASGESYSTYSIYFKESVSGLSVQSPVKYNGVQVGYVKAIRLNPNNPEHVQVLVNIEQEIPIHEDTAATLETQGLTGVSYVGLRGGKPDTPLAHKIPGHKYPQITSKPSLMLRLDTTLRVLATNLDDITDNVRKILNKENRVAIQETLTSMAKFSTMLGRNTETLNNTIQDFNAVLIETKKASQQFPALVQDTRSAITAVKKMAHRIGVSGHTAITTFNNNIQPQLYTTLQKINTLATNLNQLTLEVEQNPGVLLRGKQPAAPGPGEK